MISPLNNLVQALGQGSHAYVPSSAKPHATHTAASNEDAPKVSVAIPPTTEGGSPTSAGQSISSNNPLTAILTPIGDRDQAAAATQHARLLLQSQPRVAIVAQANAYSQSVQRLLQ